MARLYARRRRLWIEAGELDDPLQLERALFAAKLAVGDQQQFASRPSDVQRLDNPIRAVLVAVQILHHHRLALLEGLLELEREQALARTDGEQPHRAALLAQGVAQTDRPPADRLDELLEDEVGRLGVGEGAMGDHRLDSKPRGERLKPVAAPSKPASGNPDGIKDRNVAQHLGDLFAAAAEFLAQEREIEPNVMAEQDCALEKLEGGGKLLAKRRLAVHHLLGNSRKRGDARADAPLGVDELGVFGDFLAPLDAHDPQLDHAMTELGGRAGGFHVEERQRRVVQRLEEREGHSIR